MSRLRINDWEGWNEFAREATNLLRDKFQRSDIMASCLTCRHIDAFDEFNPVCKKFGGQRPPLRVLVNGCTDYDDNADIPF